MEKEKTVCFSGHRIIPFEKRIVLAQRLEKTIIELIKTGNINFAAGGALGFDTIAAEAIINLKIKYPHIGQHSARKNRF